MDVIGGSSGGGAGKGGGAEVLALLGSSQDQAADMQPRAEVRGGQWRLQVAPAEVGAAALALFGSCWGQADDTSTWAVHLQPRVGVRGAMGLAGGGGR